MGALLSGDGHVDLALPNQGLWRKAFAEAINRIIVAGLGGGEPQLVVMICAQI